MQIGGSNESNGVLSQGDRYTGSAMESPEGWITHCNSSGGLQRRMLIVVRTLNFLVDPHTLKGRKRKCVCVCKDAIFFLLGFLYPVMHFRLDTTVFQCITA